MSTVEQLEIRIDLAAAAALAKAFAAAPEIVAEELTAATWEASLLVEREIKELTPAGIGSGGGLRGSIAAREPRADAGGVVGMVATPLSYAVPVELGSRPHFPPVQPLEDWVRHKLGLGGAEARSAAFAIARTIASRGTTGVHMFQRAMEANQAQVHRIFAAARERIALRTGEA